ncbi:sodium-dependent transporter, SNF family [Thermococcus kodakarensis KOD1]|uniref:Sodium-dependent transporter, SNF family n=1 Tax=Thermococcus kodakarensis (strain ATCC BAA-918 / JCM 12380 / KOD1) TaxID=69014 RepID=Q5JDK2_THEKO|nr:sodium-dependent transporter [Thermococcus kodakarensis]WCN27404.1 sodium-dependent transporter [Thermococcus kodakarensis]WCN29694.1 sodium-dependent transporter [Thermococcus kodakarensis]BAD85621.1 sodium-dependent transporter, SNF family [Thermococcus kodakarensis KOD1]
MEAQRDQWATKLGLILAMAGNAVGLGNFVRFPTQVAQNGGGAFMVPYFIALFFLGIPVMWVEWVAGRYGGKYGHGTLGPTYYLMARESLKPRSAFWFGVISGMLAFSLTVLLNSYYLHLIGWSAAYTYFSAAGSYFGQPTGEFFSNYLSNHGQVMLFWGITVILLAIAVGQGVSKGIERWVKVMMPLLYVFAILMIIYIFTLGSPVDPNWSTIDGFRFIWTPNWSYLGDHLWQVMLAATGQIFFTLSLGMSIIQNYASYLGPKDDVALSGIATVSLNEFAEVVLGGSIAIPLATAYAPKIVPPDVLQQGKTAALEWIGQKFGLGFSYTSLPNVFVSMGDIGRLFGALWFLLLWFAGFTSAIAMYNYLVAMLEEDMHIKRSVGTWVIFLVYLIAGLPVIYIDGYMDQVDAWVSFQLTLLAFFDIIIAVYLFKPDNFWRELHEGAWIKVPEFYKWVTLYIAPLLLLIPMIGYFKPLVQTTLEWPARLAIILMWILGAIESYYAIKKKYKEELDKNEVIIKV